MARSNRYEQQHLTQEQVQAWKDWQQQYLAWGLSTEPADRARAEAAFAAAYRLIGRDPVPVAWVGSPLSANLLYGVLQQFLPGNNSEIIFGNGFGNSFRDRYRFWLDLGTELQPILLNLLSKDVLSDCLWFTLQNGLANILQECLENSLRTIKLDGVGNTLRESLQASLEDLVDGLGASSKIKGEDKLRVNLWPGLYSPPTNALNVAPPVQPWAHRTSWYGRMAFYWLACYRFFEDVFGVSFSPRDHEILAIMDAIGQSCGWWYPFEDWIIACERPVVIQMEEHPQRPGVYRLHAADGPAIQFRDGWAIYAWRGIRVPAKLIETPSQITRADILAETNVEVRRAMFDRLGPDRFAALFACEPVHEASWNGQTYTLLRTIEPDPLLGVPLQFVRVVCPSTGRVYHLPVPPTLSTAREAVAWTFGLDAETYQPEVER